MEVSLSIDVDDVSPAVRRLLPCVQPETLMKIGGKRLEMEVRKHFQDLDRRPNKRGWPSRHFWRGIARSTALDLVTRQTARVAITDPAFWGKVKDTKIKPKRGRFLAIPATAAAYAAGSPREGAAPASLKLTRDINPATGRMQWCLAIVDSQAATVWYWLARQARIPKDPDALPPDAHLRAAVLDAIEQYVKRVGGVAA